MKIIQHYAQGGKHKANDLPCEDRTYYMCANNVSVIALADGAGGKRYTHAAKGAECVTKTICEFFCNNFDKFDGIEDSDEMKNIFTAVCHHNLKLLAEKEGLDDISKLSSTLLVVAVKDKKAIVCHIGDGVIGRVSENSTRVVSAPENGEFANHTFFISNPAASEHLNITKMPIDDVVSFFLMSDGTAEYVYDEDAARFHDSARKMSLMALEENGEEKLADTIETFMIGPDPTSDDCSFITMLFEEKVTGLDVGLPKDNYEGEIVTPLVAEMPGMVEPMPQQDSYDVADVNSFAQEPVVTQSAPQSKGINVNLLKIIAAVIAILTVLLFVYSINKVVDIEKEKSNDSHTSVNKEDEDEDVTGDNEPGGNEPGDNKPGGNEPGDNEPGGNEPGGNEPGDNKPGGNEPGDNEPGDNEPGDNEPGDNEPGGNEPGGNGTGGNGTGGNGTGGNGTGGNGTGGNGTGGNGTGGTGFGGNGIGDNETDDA